ncbi:unnamed protein product, partial [Hapterophycus canaliculatus]
QNKQKCWCGSSSDDYDKHGQTDDSECELGCTGDNNETCGGFWRIAVYSTSSGVGSFI